MRLDLTRQFADGEQEPYTVLLGPWPSMGAFMQHSFGEQQGERVVVTSPAGDGGGVPKLMAHGPY